MIEWLSSKVAMAVAVLVITGSVLGYFAYQRSASYEGEVAEVARSTARYIETFATLSGAVRVSITFGDGGNKELPPSINGNPVIVNITDSMVIVTCGKYVVSEGHTVPFLHFWSTENRSMNTTAIALVDLEHRWTGDVASPDEIVLERRSIFASGTEKLFTFCYPSSHLPD